MPEIPLSYFALAYAPWVLMLSGAFYLGLRLVRAFERRSSARAEIAALEERLLRLEEGASTISDRVERLAEGHEFTARLLTDRK